MENEVQKIMDQINALKMQLEMQKLTEQMNKLKAQLEQEKSEQKLMQSEQKSAPAINADEQSNSLITNNSQLQQKPVDLGPDMQQLNAKILVGLKIERQQVHNLNHRLVGNVLQWNSEQLLEFRKLVRTMRCQNGDADWDRIGQKFNLSAQECMESYPEIKRLSKHNDLTEWSDEQVQELKAMVEAMRQNGGEVNWDNIGQMCDRNKVECYNKLHLVTDSEWTAEQKEMLLNFWKENKNDLDISGMLPKLEGHSERSVQLKLEEFTKMSNTFYTAPKMCKIGCNDQKFQKCNVMQNIQKCNGDLWTQENLLQLTTIVKSMKPNVDWNLVGQKCGRSGFMCRHQYYQMVNSHDKRFGYTKMQNKRYGVNWTPEQLQQLKSLVSAVKGKVNWEEIGVQLHRRTWHCHNIYVKSMEPEWTTQENEILLKNWEENWEDFDLMGIMPQLGKHTEKGAMFQLEDLTANNDIYLLRYQISRIDRLNYNGQLDFE